MDWAGLLRIGLCQLRLPPAAFWQLTPVELRIMLGVDAGSRPLTRQRLDELAAAYPDAEGQADGGYGTAGGSACRA